jgi:phosphatidylglycerophosphate synthase
VLIAVPSTAVTGVIVAALLALGYLLDSADGQVARLSGTGSRAGEWLDHVVDALRTPALHLAALVGLWLHGGLPTAILAIPLLYSVLSAGQAMSQMLAEQLSGRVHRPVAGGGRLKSVALLPTDTGLLCWLFVLWGAPALFAAAYTAVFLFNAVHTAISMRRKYTHLVNLEGVRP